MMTLHLVIYLFCLMKDLFILTQFLSFHICRRNMYDLKKSLQLLMFCHPCLPNYHLTIIGNIKLTSKGLYQACTEATRVSLQTNPSSRNRTNQRKQVPYTGKMFRNHSRTRLFENLSIGRAARSLYHHNPNNAVSSKYNVNKCFLRVKWIGL